MKRCECCDKEYPPAEDHGDLLDGICEDCESGYVVCNICKERQDDDDTCRHVFWSEGIWYGSGSYEDPPEEFKASLSVVLDKTDLVYELRRAITNGTFYLFFHGSMLGPEWMDCYADGRNYGHRFTDDLAYEQEEAMGDGVGWLTSLYKDETPEANAVTVGWIDEHLAMANGVP